MPRDENVGRMEFLLSLRRRGISDAAVLRAMDAVPREHFVLPEFADAAYADQAMPIACGQTISQPYVVAYMTEQLDVKREHRVLEVGTGSGYQAAILSQLAGEVVTVERYRTLAEGARKALAGLGLRQCHGAGRRRAQRRAGARALRPHHRHGGGRDDPARRWSTSWPRAA